MKSAIGGQRSCFLLIALSLLLYPRAAITQESAAAEADKLNKQISELYQQGQFAEAIPLAQRVVEILRQEVGENHPDYARGLNMLAAIYDAQGQYTEAEPLYKQALSIRERALGPEHPDVAISLNNLAVLYQEEGRYDEAEPLCKRSLAIQEKALGPGHPDVATSLNNLAELYQGQGRYAEAEPLYKRSLAIFEKALGPDDPKVASGLNNLARVFQGQAKYAEAEPLFKQALSIREKALGPEHPDVAVSLNNLAQLYRGQGKYAEAEPLYKRSLAIFEKALGPDHPDVASSLNNLALFYKDQGKYAEAEPLYKRSLAIRERALGPEHPAVAGVLANLAVLYREEGKYAEAEPLFKQALSIREKTLGPEHPEVAINFANLARLYGEQGRLAEAEPLLMRSLAIFEKTLGPDHPFVATCLNDLAMLYDMQGRSSEAESLFKRALAIDDQALGPDHPDMAAVLINLAALYLELGRYADAEPLFKRGLMINEKALGPDHPTVADSLSDLAELYHSLGRFAEAETLLERGRGIRERAFGPDHPDVANSLNNLGSLLNEQSRYGEAERLYKRALAIFEKVLGPDHPSVATSLYNLATFYFAQDKFAEAEPFFERGLQNLSRQFEYNFLYMSEKERLQFLDTVSFFFPVYFGFCMSYRDKLPALAGQMYDVVLWEKGFVAQTVAALRAKIQTDGDPDALRLLDRLTEKRNQLAKLVSSPAGSDPQKQAARRAELRELEKEANELEKELVARSSALGEEKRLAHTSWQQIRASLKPDEAAIEVVRFRFYDGKKWSDASYYVALVLRHESRQPEFVVLGEQKEIEKVPLADYRRLVAAPETDAKRPEGLGHRFYAAFWKPLESTLKGASRIYICPDGELNQVSLGVVPGAGARPLMETYELRTVNSTKDLLRAVGSPAAGTAALIGNPKFDLSEIQQRAALRALRPAQTDAAPLQEAAREGLQDVVSLRSRDLRGGGLQELKGTQQEVADVAEILKREGWQVEMRTGSEALEERVKDIRRPRILHLATHGFFEADQSRRLRDSGEWIGGGRAPVSEDPMLRSGLYLTGANRVLRGGDQAPDLDDGVLTAYEASQLDLQGTELVVLSACETGLGKVEAGEGVFGLRRAFQVAGARAVLMSMWSVPDEETRELMALFYAKWLVGKDKHVALREAQLEMREKVKARYGEDLPLYWGAFVLVGR